MPKKIILFFVSFLFLFSFKLVSASVVLNEIMYDLEIGSDTDREWVEVYNNGTEMVDFSSYKFFEANTNHSLSVVQGDKNIPAGGYAVIVQNKDKFKIDWPDFSGAIFDSSFSLGNETGEMLAIKDADLNIIDQYTYSGASGGMGDGKSLQLVSGAWQASLPTPGAINTNTNNGGGETGGENTNMNPPSASSDSGSSTSSASPKKPEELKTKVTILAKKEAFVGLALSFKANGFDKNGTPLFYGKYFWNFGDGGSKEIQVNNFYGINHTYFYPGIYTVTLEYYINDYGEIPEAISSMVVNVVKNDILISGVGDEKDFFVEITNNTDYNIDISKWILQTSDKNFIFPKNTFVPSKNKIIISPKITGFTILAKDSLKLLDQDWQEVFDYSFSVAPVLSVTTNKIKNPVYSNTENKNQISNSAEEIDLNNFNVSPQNSDQEGGFYSQFDSSALGAQAIQGNPNSNEINKNNYFYYWFFGLVVLCGVVAVYFIRKNKIIKKEEGEDFDILDE